MKRVPIRIALLLILSSLVAARAEAVPFTIGNSTPTTVFFVQGQSFTPSVQGNLGTGTPPADGDVYLTSFTIDYAPGSAPSEDLFIYGVLPTTADAATGAGSLGAGTHIGGGLYAFADLALDVDTKYFAVLPEPSDIFDGSGNLYAGGVDIFDRPIPDGQLDEGFGDFDIGFRATFDTRAVPEPATAILTCLGLIALGLRKTARRG